NIDKPMAIISGLLMLIAVIAIFVNGLNLGLDFTGGVSADVKYQQPVEQTVVVQSLEKNGFNDPVVQYLGTRQDLLVRLPPQETNAEGLTESLNKALNLQGNKADVQNVNIIGGQVGNEIYLNSLMAMGLALACMLLYVAVRFQFKLSVGAVVALFHDAIITLGVFAIFQFPFDLTVLAAVLALIGYSLNDTIVVYDRIRENFRRVRGLSPKKVVDLSLTETLRRTIMTSMTVILVVGAMMILGGDGLYWFSVTLMIGLIAGTYSSVYIASAIPLMMGMTRDDFIVTVKPEFIEEEVVFEDKKAPIYEADEY
ncbi:MAG: protein translocase subunit SecF, partial [Moraxellaceae bacterium]|nr:protein translocase subunit SecF [Moraxellaceae bacterium]